VFKKLKDYFTNEDLKRKIRSLRWELKYLKVKKFLKQHGITL